MIPMEGGTQGSLKVSKQAGVKGSMESMDKAREDTILSPRFYTTDFEAMDRLDVGLVRSEWNAVIKELRADHNKNHFTKSDEFKNDLEQLSAGAAQGVQGLSGELADRGVLRLRALCRDQEADQEQGYPGTVQLHEPRRGAPRRLHQRNPQGSRYRRRSLVPHQSEEVHLLSTEIHLLRDVSFREDRLRPLHHDLPADGAASRAPVPPDLPLVRTVVQRRVPSRRGICAVDARRSVAAAGFNKLWIRFFLLAVFATMYVRDHMRPAFHEALGMEPTDYDMRVFRITSEISKQVFPVTLDLDDPRFLAGLERLADHFGEDRRRAGPRRLALESKARGARCAGRTGVRAAVPAAGEAECAAARNLHATGLVRRGR